MPLVRVTTTEKCSPNLQVGPHVYQPGRSVEQLMEPEDLDLLQELAAEGAPLGLMFSTVTEINEPGGRPAFLPPPKVLATDDAQADLEGKPRPTRSRSRSSEE